MLQRNIDIGGVSVRPSVRHMLILTQVNDGRITWFYRQDAGTLAFLH